MSSDSVLRTRGLGKCYHIYERPQDRLWQGLWRGRRRFYREFWALRGVDLEIGRGETVAVIGRNGSGKSTLLQLIAGTLAASEGGVEVGGRLAALLELGSGFNPEYSGRENVFMNGALLGLERAEIERRFDEIAAFADIGEFIDQPVRNYSSGMRMRLAFAVSACVEPEILIVDEALAVGDMAFQMKCLERLDALSRSGMTLLFVSHDIYTVKAFCRRAVYLEGGRIKAVGSASDMVELYLLDTREAQRRGSAAGDAAMRRKPALGSAQGIAFGTGQGRVARACFADSRAGQSSYLQGEPVRVRVEVEYDATLRQPSLSLMVHDHRMVDLAGHFFSLPAAGAAAGTRRTALEIAFPAAFGAGQFFITLRLEERASYTNFFPIDKQVGALSFHVTRPADASQLGLVSLPFEARPIEFEDDTQGVPP